jgi:hypothetical protein
MNRLRAQIGLVVLGAVVLGLAVVVLVRNRSPDDEILGTIAALGGLAIIVNALLDSGGD